MTGRRPFGLLLLLVLLGASLAGCVGDKGEGGSDADDGGSDIPNGPPPDPTKLHVDFSWAPDPALPGQDVLFADESRAATNDTITGWSWQFTDGAVATASSPTHAFPSAGLHPVTLRVLTEKGEVGERTRDVLIVTSAGAGNGTTSLPGDLNGDSWVVIATVDTGINPYHMEFRDERLATHPSAYLTGYPAGALAIPLTFNASEWSAAKQADLSQFTSVSKSELYWFPGTKIVGARDAGDDAPTLSAEDTTPLLDDDGHGTAVASLAAGNTLGGCPQCLVVAVEDTSGLAWAAAQPWIDIVSNSWGTIGNLDVPLPDGATKAAAERGQTILFASGNGVDLSYVVPEQTYTSRTTGPSWTVVVGGAHTDGTVIAGTGHPVDVASFAEGNVRGASHLSFDSVREFGGTSAATPYVAGVMGHVLLEARRLGKDVVEAPRAVGGKAPVLAVSATVADSAFLDDGLLTRSELWRIAFLAASVPRGLGVCPLGLCVPGAGGGNAAWLHSGYGIVDPAAKALAVDLLLGDAETPVKSQHDTWKNADWAARDTLWGSWDRGD